MKNERKVIEGELFNEIEELGNKKYVHIGFRNKENNFGDIIEKIVPKVGMIKKAKLTIELLDEEIKEK